MADVASVATGRAKVSIRLFLFPQATGFLASSMRCVCISSSQWRGSAECIGKTVRAEESALKLASHAFAAYDQRLLVKAGNKTDVQGSVR